MALKLKVSREDFTEAKTDGWVDGQVRGQSALWAYVELGKKVKYIPHPKDDPKTEYKRFIRCNVFYAESQQMLENEEWQAEDYNVTVIIYC